MRLPGRVSLPTAGAPIAPQNEGLALGSVEEQTVSWHALCPEGWI